MGKCDTTEKLLSEKFETSETDRTKVSSALMVKTNVLARKFLIPDRKYGGSGKVEFTITGSPIQNISYEDHEIKMKNIFEMFYTDTVKRMTKDVSQLKFHLHQILMLAHPNLEQLMLYTDKLNGSSIPKGSSVDAHGGVVALNLMKISQKLFLMLCVKHRGVIEGKIQTPFG